MLRLRLSAIAASVIGILAVPTGAHAAGDIGVSQTASAAAVKPGGPVTIDITVADTATVPPSQGDVFIRLLSLSGHGQPADNPYRSITTSQGTCAVDSEAGSYQSALCSLGAVPPGTSVHIVAVITVNQSMNHIASVRSQLGFGEYPDANGSNNESGITVAADKPPVVSGSKKLLLKGLPEGCFSENFSLLIVAKAPNIKKVVFSTLPLDEFGNGEGIRKTARASRLRVTVPVSKFFPLLGKLYEFRVKARPRGRPPLKATVTFERC